MARSMVAVVGAGTSGLIAARSLSRLGVATTVYDQKRVLGYPVRASGILSINGLKGLGIGYHSGVTNTLSGARIHAGGQTMSVRSKEPIAHVLDRIKLNDICRQEAEDAGAKVVLERKVDAGALTELHKDNIIIGADGPVSVVAKHFGLGGTQKHVLTYKAEYDVPGLDDMVDLFFDKELAPDFFAWFCPNTKNVLEVGIGINPGHGNAKAAFDRFVKTPDVAKVLDGARMLDGAACIIPMQLRKRIVDAEQEVLLVGDAAGQIKPSTGGGIIFGGHAAMMAADAVKDHIESGASLDAYEKRFRKLFMPDIKMHAFVNRLYSKFGTRGFGRMLGIMNALGMDGFLSRYGDMDRPTVMLRRFFLRSRA